MIRFFIPMRLPTKTYQEKKIRVVGGKPVLYEPAELAAVRCKFRDSMAAFVPKEPMKGALQLVTKWCFPITGKHHDGEYRTSKPDTDNLVKMLKDVMTGLHFWRDDAQVASEVIEKFWAASPGLFVAIQELGGERT